MMIKQSLRPLYIGDVVTVYTTGIGPGSQGLTGIIVQKTDKYLYLGLFSAQKKITAIATIPFVHITTIIQRLS